MSLPEQHKLQNRNYQRELEALIQEFQKKGIVPKLLLHSCCAPCSSYVLEYLSQYFEVTVLYYNPNISPREEYDRRVQEQHRLIREMSFVHPVSLVVGTYDPERFYEKTRGLEKAPEGGERCAICYRMRMEQAALLAQKEHFDFFTTTLSISPLKKSAVINQIGEELSEIYQVTHLPSDFKKKNGFKRSTELSAEHHLYRQNFCGCVFSRPENRN